MDHVAMMRRAKSQLSGNWLMAAVATLIFSVIMGAANFTYVGGLLLFGPLMFGYVAYIRRLADTKVSEFNDLFSGFNYFVNTMVAGLLYSLIVGVGLVLFIVPGIIAMCGLSMTFFIMVDDPRMSGTDALQASWNMMKGRKMDYFCFILRFFGWWLLACLTCGVGYFFLMPYVTTSTLHYYRQLRYNTF